VFAHLQDRRDDIGATVRQVMQQHPHLSSRTRQFQSTIEGRARRRGDARGARTAGAGIHRPAARALRLEDTRLLRSSKACSFRGARRSGQGAAGDETSVRAQRRDRFLSLFERLRQAGPAAARTLTRPNFVLKRGVISAS